MRTSYNLGHHFGPPTDAEKYDLSADMADVALRLDAAGVPLNREGSGD